MGAQLVSSEPRRTTDWTPNSSPVPLSEEGGKGQEKKLVNNSYLQPWMVEVVKSSLPPLVDSLKIQEVLEEAKGILTPLKVQRGKKKGTLVEENRCVSPSLER